MSLSWRHMHPGPKANCVGCQSSPGKGGMQQLDSQLCCAQSPMRHCPQPGAEGLGLADSALMVAGACKHRSLGFLACIHRSDPDYFSDPVLPGWEI